ncbi:MULTISPECIES: hypothetical protein [Microbacterium]|uniref:hypothetical protein n=1 Tax=Microbacterium TaxID=33882 RepID=UPI00217D0044|nr:MULTISPECIES: hypothetical protein [Microbacterium]UWF76687.1 hypothetical protein JSY13_07370 [Microbacterium neungamense]WCM54837.1 hypothetical protein JRG78_07370 [Microbacterium sp. EF45047]
MLRIAILAVRVLLSAWLVLWVAEGLLGVDQRNSLLPFRGDDPTIPAVLIGVAWGVLGTFGSAFSGIRRRPPQPGDEVAIGRIVEVQRTGLRVNEIPQYDVFVRVSPPHAGEFVARLRTLVRPEDQAILRIGRSIPVSYAPGRHDDVSLADTGDPAVRKALLDWRIAKGLIDPRLVPARTTGVTAPADVVAVRPTGRRREGQSELALTVLVSPEGQTAWQAETTVFVYPEAVGQLQVGSPVWAMYRPEDPRRVAVTLHKEEAA